MKKIILYFSLIFLIILLSIICYFFVGSPKEVKNIIWGVNFSQKHAKDLGLDWKETYSALLDDLKVRNLKVAVHWDIFEPEKDKYDFKYLDWQIEEAGKRGAKILLVIGMKTPRWPECHIPEWAKGLTKSQQQKKILEMLREIVLRYKNSPTIKYWQVENEPFFSFGQCPWVDRKFLRKEVAEVKSLDSQKRPVIVTESGEWSPWVLAAGIGDIVGVTMYRVAWFHNLKRYIRYSFPSVFYWRKSLIVKKFFGKKVICVELQAEPWGPVLLYDLPLEEQRKTMNLEQFKKNINFARKTGLDEFYLWGGEWWYWMKVKQGEPQIWQEAKKLFSS